MGDDNASGAIPPSLSERLDALARAAHPGLRAGCRRIATGDELALTSAELRPLERSIDSVRRASGAARIVAKALLKQDGIFSGLKRSDEPGTTEAHLIEMLTAGWVPC